MVKDGMLEFRDLKVGVFVAAFFVTAFIGGCANKRPAEQKVDKEYIQRNLLEKTPEKITQINADFDGKLLYLGNNASTYTVAPGNTLKLTHYWQVKEAPGAEWRVF